MATDSTHIKYCPECKREIPIGASRCPYCGTNIARDLTQIKFCSECEREVPRDALLCPYCGTKFPIKLTGKLLCPKCRKEIPKDAILCPYCGFIVNEETSRITKKVQNRNLVKNVVVSLIIILIVLTIIFAPIIPYPYNVEEQYQGTQTKSEIILNVKNIIVSPNSYVWWLVNVPSRRVVVFNISANQTTAIKDTLYAYVLNQAEFTSYNNSYNKQGGYSSASHNDVGSNMKISFTTGSNYEGDLYFIIANQADPMFFGFVDPPTRKIVTASASTTWQEPAIEIKTVEHTKYVSLFQLLTGTV